jgi:hypothetical protein
MLSPAVPHRFYRHITADTYRNVVQGKTNLVVETQVRYRGPRGDKHCYLMRDSYNHIDSYFLSLGLVPKLRPSDRYCSGPLINPDRRECTTRFFCSHRRSLAAAFRRLRGDLQKD